MLLQLWIALFVIANKYTLATSYRKKPFKRVYSPSSPSFRILRRHRSTILQPSSKRLQSLENTIQSSDTFLLRFNLEADPVSILLRPSTHLIHPHGIKVYTHETNPVGQNSIRTEIMTKDMVRAFEGEIVREDQVERYWNEELSNVDRLSKGHRQDGLRGFASLQFREDPTLATESWEGSMLLDGVTHHFKPTHAYLRERSSADPDLPIASLARRGLLGGGTVIMRETDSLPEDVKHNELEEAFCSHDHLSHNLLQQQQTDLFFASQSVLRSNAHSSWSPFSSDWPLRPALSRRQDIAGSGNISSYSNSIGSTVGCPTERKVIYIGVAADCSAVQSFGSVDETKTSILSYINSVSTLYTNSFNVSIGVVEMQVMDESCPTSANASQPWNLACSNSSSGVDLNDRLSLFSQWRSDKGGSDGVGVWHLLTNCASGSEVGVAWLNTLCQVTATSNAGQTTSGTAVTSLTDRTWEVMAHEIGHNFGAIHDCSTGCSATTDTVNGVSCCPLTSSTCDANSNYIMSPVSSKNTTTFSACSIGNICTTIQSTLNTTCLVDPGSRTTLSAQQCGNGILEPGEECDPGTSSSNCCDVATCKLLSGALCDPSNSSCCTSSCGYSESSTVCRPSVNSQCDPAEYCTGNTATCPTDTHTADGTTCGSSGQGLSCAAGQCTSRDLQCEQQGSSLNLTKACAAATDSSCQISCADPSSNSDCILLSSYFSDGTSCGLSGRCYNGDCQSGSVGNTIAAWISRYPQIAYPVIIIGCLLILSILVGLIRCCMRRRRSRTTPPSLLYTESRSKRRGLKQRKSRISSTKPPPLLSIPSSSSTDRSSGTRQQSRSHSSQTNLMRETLAAPVTAYHPSYISHTPSSRPENRLSQGFGQQRTSHTSQITHMRDNPVPPATSHLPSYAAESQSASAAVSQQQNRYSYQLPAYAPPYPPNTAPS